MIENKDTKRIEYDKETATPKLLSDIADELKRMNLIKALEIKVKALEIDEFDPIKARQVLSIVDTLIEDI